MMSSKSGELAANAKRPQPDFEPSLDRTAGLEHAPNDIHYLVASELMKSSPSAVLALGQSSTALRQAALPFIYRDLVLTKGTSNSEKEKAYEALIETFRKDVNYKVAQHVRSITIKDDLPEEDLLTILNKIAECGTLKKLSWNTSAHMPESVLDKLTVTWPDLELSVHVLDRHKAVLHRQMDIRLLSSPLLKSLTYNIIRGGYHARDPAPSEWPKLTQALVAGGQVRVLRIQSQPDGSSYNGTEILDDAEPKKLMRLDITSGTRLPALEEFGLFQQRDYGDPTYLWDEEHCHMLRDSMDWSRLRKLDFGIDRPDAFFTTFTGLLPQLKALRFGAHNESFGPVIGFMDSVTALEALDIGRSQYFFDALWPSVMKHKDTLKELVLRPSRSAYHSLQYLEMIAEQFPLLECLGWDIPCDTKADPEHLAMLSQMNLKKADIFATLPFETSYHAGGVRKNVMENLPPHSLDAEKSKTAAISIMETISQAQGRPLERLTFHLTKIRMGNRGGHHSLHTKMQLRRRGEKELTVEDGYELRGKLAWRDIATYEEELNMNEE